MFTAWSHCWLSVTGCAVAAGGDNGDVIKVMCRVDAVAARYMVAVG
jgi:hypothetical protein